MKTNRKAWQHRITIRTKFWIRVIILRENTGHHLAAVCRYMELSSNYLEKTSENYVQFFSIKSRKLHAGYGTNLTATS